METAVKPDTIGSMPSFILRNIDPELWVGVKAQAAKEGRPLRWLILRLLALYARVGLDKLEKSAD